MRSELVFTAKTSIPNRYQLCSSVSAATRKLHREGSSFSESINEAMTYFAEHPISKQQQATKACVIPIRHNQLKRLRAA